LWHQPCHYREAGSSGEGATSRWIVAAERIGFPNYLRAHQSAAERETAGDGWAVVTCGVLTRRPEVEQW
jgi:hypothetical protein